MALKAVHVSDVPNLDHVANDAAALSLRSPSRASMDHGEGFTKSEFKFPKFVVAGHRGCGVNSLDSSDVRFKSLKENSILSFNAAAKIPVDFIEFDVQVTKDDYPVIFHDVFIFAQDQGTVVEKRVTEITLSEFLSYGLQKEPGNVGKPLLRKAKDGNMYEWKVESDDSLCTLQEVFQKVDHSVGFNIELKFDDNVVYEGERLERILQAILKVVYEYGADRPIIFSTFLPDAALLIRKLQSTYPVFFLTNGGNEIYKDPRRNSLDEAIKLCQDGGLQGIVSEVRAIFRRPEAVSMIKESRLSLLTYGRLNNVPEVVYMQYVMGVEGVIVDLVKEITDVVTDLIHSDKEDGEEGRSEKVGKKPRFTKDDLSFLLKLIPHLLQN